MRQDIIAQAYAALDKALKCDERRIAHEAAGNVRLANLAARHVDRYLDLAVALKAKAFEKELTAA